MTKTLNPGQITVVQPTGVTSTQSGSGWDDNDFFDTGTKDGDAIDQHDGDAQGT